MPSGDLVELIVWFNLAFAFEKAERGGYQPVPFLPPIFVLSETIHREWLYVASQQTAANLYANSPISSLPSCH
jgi:hypothetical protein